MKKVGEGTKKKKKSGRSGTVGSQFKLAQHQSSASESDVTLGTVAVHVLSVGPSDVATTGASCWYTIPEHPDSRATAGKWYGAMGGNRLTSRATLLASTSQSW
ncbi:hypothetical protein MTO96_026988 [Rhipicephalus appendiculatus]